MYVICVFDKHSNVVMYYLILILILITTKSMKKQWMRLQLILSGQDTNWGKLRSSCWHLAFLCIYCMVCMTHSFYFGNSYRSSLLSSHFQLGKFYINPHDATKVYLDSPIWPGRASFLCTNPGELMGNEILTTYKISWN